MPTTSKDVIAAYNLTPRDVDIAIKALITMVDGNLKSTIIPVHLTSSLNTRPFLRGQPAGRPGVVGSQLDVGQVQEESNNSVEADTTAAVGRATGLPEEVDVLLEAGAVGVDALGAHAGLELGWVVNTLTARHDFLSYFIRLSHLAVLRVLLGVEWPRRLGELVQHIEVGAVLLADDDTQGLLLRRRHVLVIGDVAELFGTLLTEELLALGECEADLLTVLGEREGLGRVNGPHEGDLLLAALLEVAEDVEE
ncbi:hypothetical protein VM1G_08880 [Cytospora mali]|uniref:Uncharacterized protein n=1 Tax=Cytospora mali TaxID=578113 RepID=A0A194WAT7_CYTMA|nr:hypothetical protein VM1G_08880 [Valsa mali]